MATLFFIVLLARHADAVELSIRSGGMFINDTLVDPEALALFMAQVTALQNATSQQADQFTAQVAALQNATSQQADQIEALVNLTAGLTPPSSDPYTTTTIAQQQAYVKASNPDAFDSFGLAMALSADGNTLAVGAPFEASLDDGVNANQLDNSGMSVGAVYVFVRDGGGSWTQEAYIKASNSGDGDAFGWNVALSGNGNTLAVSAYTEASSAVGINGNQGDNTAPNSGAVYMFTRTTGGVWTQSAYVKASNTEANDAFGYAIALSTNGNVLAVGAYYEDSVATGVNGDQADNTAGDSGAVYVFMRSPSGNYWTQTAYVKASNTRSGANFGIGVSINGNGTRLAVGSHTETSSATGINGDETNTDLIGAGAVYVYDYISSAGMWIQHSYIKASNTGTSDQFGTSVSISDDGTRMVVGAINEASCAGGIDGDQSDNSCSGAGAVYVYEFDTAIGTWSQTAFIKAVYPDANDAFGNSAVMSKNGRAILVGAYTEDSAATGLNGDGSDDSAPNAGAAYLYVRSEAGVWSQHAYIKGSNTETNDYLAYGIALNADASTVVVGADGECSAATGINGNEADNSACVSGAVYVLV